MASSTSTSVEVRSQVFQTGFEDICREIQGSVLPNIIMPWIDDDGVATDSCILGPSLEGGMPERLAVHLKDKMVDLSAFDGGGLPRLERRSAAALMANLDPRMGEVDAEDGAFLRPAVEG
ncbi:hypothetical protein Pyn_27434 [Prunus yedoensis var. nudiflora]|uniref:Uncharacterized protein n=1 Tax=Prunus yedoensis var. nudiflora TaxID=2094558 RepID=A0A314XIQ4_PRUYE|nr:hypothetical protein Pyn_27434 [Prunus yedoensis var. nudiflora]